MNPPTTRLHLTVRARFCLAAMALWTCTAPAPAQVGTVPASALAPLPAPRALDLPLSGTALGNRSKGLGDEFECLVEPNMTASLGTQVPGVIAEVLVDRGDMVRAGQVVARLQSDAEQAGVELKRVQVEYGRRRVQRNEELVRQELLSEAERDDIETQSRMAAVELKQQESLLAQRTIRAPFDGVVVDRMLNPGDRVYEEKIVRLAQLDPLRVEVVVSAQLRERIQKGMRAEVSLSPSRGGRHAARVTVVDRVVDAATGTVGVRLQLPNPGSALPSGLRCSLRFQP